MGLGDNTIQSVSPKIITQQTSLSLEGLEEVSDKEILDPKSSFKLLFLFKRKNTSLPITEIIHIQYK